MPPQIKVPADFNAVVITSPREVSSATVAHIQATAEKLGLPRLRSHRILFASQVEYCDSSAVAAMMGIMQRAHEHGKEFVVCNPSPIVRRYLEIYGASSLIAGHILYANEQGFYETTLMPFVPPYVPALDGRWDIYTNGKVKSFVLRPEGAVDTPPVDLNNYAIPTVREVVRKSGQSRIMSRVPRAHEGLVVVRRFQFKPEEAMSRLDSLHKLLDWYKSKGFDFRGVYLWQDETNHGQFTEVLSFRDRAHYDAFKTLLKVDTAWKDLNAKLGNVLPEIHMQF